MTSVSIVNCECEMCHKPLYRKQSYIKKTGHITCSYECSYKLRSILYSGDGNPQYGCRGNRSTKYIGETIVRHGYMKTICADHPYADGANRVLTHRLIAEKYLLDDLNSFKYNGKMYLHIDYCVHHIDFDRLNNDIHNLCVLRKSDHSAMHMSFKTIIRDERGRIKTVEFNFDKNSKTSIISEFYKYIQTHSIYYHMLDSMNIM